MNRLLYDLRDQLGVILLMGLKLNIVAQLTFLSRNGLCMTALGKFIQEGEEEEREEGPTEEETTCPRPMNLILG